MTAQLFDPSGLERLGVIRRGRVEAFDEGRGLGAVREETSGQGGVYPFHCTAIADGSRTIAPLSLVHFIVRLASPGGIEATDLVGIVEAPPVR